MLTSGSMSAALDRLEHRGFINRKEDAADRRARVVWLLVRDGEPLYVSLYPVNDIRREEFLSLYRWQWLQRVSEKRMFELHTEVFEHFAKTSG
jgi:MarR family